MNRVDFKFLETENIASKTNILECSFKHFGQYKALVWMGENHVFAFALPKRTMFSVEQIWKMLEEHLSKNKTEF